MSKILKSLANTQVMLLCGIIILSSVMALLMANIERYAESTPMVSVIAPEFDYNARLKVLLGTAQGIKQEGIRSALLTDLAKEHVPMITCAFYDLVTGPKRLQRPENVSEPQWIITLWGEIMQAMGMPSDIYVDVLQLRYSWFIDTKNTWNDFQNKLEVNFVMDSLSRYITKVGNFVPSNSGNYIAAMNCKLYRTFEKTTNIASYGGTTMNVTPTTPTTQAATTTTTQTPTATPAATPTPAVTAPVVAVKPAPVAAPLAVPVPTKPTFGTLCAENGLQCTLMITLGLLIFLCIIALIIVSVSSVSSVSNVSTVSTTQY